MNNKDPRGVAFPFSKNRIAFIAPRGGALKDKHIERAGEDVVLLVKSLEPYDGGNILLKALHDIDIVDKHQLCIPIERLVLLPDIMSNAPGRRFAFIGNTLSIGADEEGEYCLPVRSATSMIYHQKGYQFPRRPVDLIFPLNFPLAGESVIETLHQMRQMVDDIVNAFGALFQARHLSPVDIV